LVICPSRPITLYAGFKMQSIGLYGKYCGFSFDVEKLTRSSATAEKQRVSCAHIPRLAS